MPSPVLRFDAVRILLDYRPALRERTGVGEFVHELARALARAIHAADDLAILTTSWKDRPAPGLAAELPGVRIVDRRIPVRLLTWSWHRLGWPAVERLAGPADVVHSQSPLLIPSSRAARVVTIHDLDFLHHPERTEAEMRRDFPRLVRAHARRADHVIVSSGYAAGEVVAHLGLPRSRISICAPGPPDWSAAVAADRDAATGKTGDEIILFLGTLEPRKNIGGLLDGYERLVARRPDAPPLVLAGRPRASIARELDRVRSGTLARRVSMPGYVDHETRLQLYRRARMLVLPSLEEGFGLPVLEAMACGVPVVISNRGSLPEVAGDAASPVDPEDADALAREMERLLDPAAARDASTRGLAQAARYSWASCAAAALDAYRAAIGRRAGHTQ